MNPVPLFGSLTSQGGQVREEQELVVAGEQTHTHVDARGELYGRTNCTVPAEIGHIQHVFI